MSLSRLSDECAGMDAEFVFGPVKIEPDHDACPGGETRPGLLGGWTCSCGCHTSVAAHVPWCGGGHDGQCAPIVLCGTPDGTEKTTREWDALYAAKHDVPTPLAERLIALIHCGACLRFRWNPGHWISCSGWRTS